MFLSKEVILSKDDCFALVESMEGFTEAKLYYKGQGGIPTPVLMPSQRNALTREHHLLQNTLLYDKINSAVKSVGYELVAPDIKYSVVKYQVGHFISKHRHDRDGNIFLTIVIQLNDSDNYKGGDFLYWIDGIEYSLDKTIGSGIVIGPEVEHEVTMVTQGERNSFVLFLEYDEVSSLSKQSLI
jgi:hypothetical protein